MNFSIVDIQIIIPEIVIAFSILVMTLSSVLLKNKKQINFYITIVTLIFVGSWLVIYSNVSGVVFNGLIYSTKTQNNFRLLVVVISLLITFIIPNFFKIRKLLFSEIYIFILGATLGALITLNSNHFLTLVVGLETLSISTYVLIAINRNNVKSVDAAFKYFIIGVFSSAIMLLGVSLQYGATGELVFGKQLFPAGPLGIAEYKTYIWGGGIFIIAISIKLAVAPLHFFAVDVYRGSPTPISAFIITIPKIVLFVLLFNFLQSPLFVKSSSLWQLLIMILANLCLVIGNGMALLQKDIKKILAYSAISHNGYILLLIVFHNQLGISVLFYYLLAYSIASVGIFSVIIKINSKSDSLNLVNLEGLYKKSPILAVVLAFFLLSLAGIPLSPGFISKLLLFNQIAASGFIQVVFTILNSLVAVVYYIVIISYSFKARKINGYNTFISKDFSTTMVIGISLFLLIILTFLPNFITLIF